MTDGRKMLLPYFFNFRPFKIYYNTHLQREKKNLQKFLEESNMIKKSLKRSLFKEHEVE